jgi:hypothetical protein
VLSSAESASDSSSTLVLLVVPITCLSIGDPFASRLASFH